MFQPETGLAGTPGFASPEQLVAQSHRKSDNYSFGKLMVMVFCNWPTSWNLLFRPITENERNQIQFNQRLMHVVRELLKVKKYQIIFLYIFQNDHFRIIQTSEWNLKKSQELCELKKLQLLV